MQASRLDLNDALKRRRVNDTPRRYTTIFFDRGDGVGACPVGGAGLMITGFWRVLDVFRGCPASILTMQTLLPDRDTKVAKGDGILQQVLGRMKTLPGVQS